MEGHSALADQPKRAGRRRARGTAAGYFEKVYSLFVDISKKMYDNKWEYISMGMSGDFADAIRAGSNMVRLGTAIFGARNYNK